MHDGEAPSPRWNANRHATTARRRRHGEAQIAMHDGEAPSPRGAQIAMHDGEAPSPRGGAQLRRFRKRLKGFRTS